MLEKGKLVLYRRWICAKFFVRAASDSFQSSFGLSQCEREGECKRILLLLSRERERASERAREREVMQIQISACRIIFRVPPFVRSFVCVKRYNIFGRKRLTFFRRRFL